MCCLLSVLIKMCDKLKANVAVYKELFLEIASGHVVVVARALNLLRIYIEHA